MLEYIKYVRNAMHESHDVQLIKLENTCHELNLGPSRDTANVTPKGALSKHLIQS